MRSFKFYGVKMLGKQKEKEICMKLYDIISE